MLDKLTHKLAEKMGKAAKEAAEPMKAEMKRTVGGKVDLYSRILRLGVLVLLFADGARRMSSGGNSPHPDPGRNSPNHIIINNYIGTDEKRKDGDG